MKTGFTTHTYEVYTNDGDRWTLDTMYNVEWRALDRAKALVAKDACNAVRVTSEDNEGTSKRKIIFEQNCSGKAQKHLTISRVDEAPLCKHINDYYQFDARTTIGRLLRTFLEERQITALELLFDYTELSILERHDNLLNQAVNRIANLQAKDAERKPFEIIDVLYDAFEEIKLRSKITEVNGGSLSMLKERKTQALIDFSTNKPQDMEPDFCVLSTFALLLSEAGDFSTKLKLITDLLDQETGKEALLLLDQLISEIMDCSGTIPDLINHEPEPARACEMLIQLTKGKVKIGKRSHPSLPFLNEAMANNSIPLTRKCLTEKVLAHIHSVKPLITGDRDDNRNALISIVRELTARTQLIGGPGMCAAVTLRAKITLKHGEDDLTKEESISSVLALIADPAVRLGYLLDLSQSELDGKYQKHIWEQLYKAEKNLLSISSLIPGIEDPKDAFVVLSELLQRLNQGTFEEPFHNALTSKINRYLRVLETALTSGKSIEQERPVTQENTPMAEEAKRSPNSTPAGTCIFSEGDAADCAYLLKSGNVEISTLRDDTKVILITLGPNQIFGELALIDGSPRSATATALTDCDLTVVTKESLETQIDGLNGFMKYWLLYLGERIRDLTDRVEKQ